MLENQKYANSQNQKTKINISKNYLKPIEFNEAAEKIT